MYMLKSRGRRGGGEVAHDWEKGVLDIVGGGWGGWGGDKGGRVLGLTE